MNNDKMTKTIFTCVKCGASSVYGSELCWSHGGEIKEAKIERIQRRLEAAKELFNQAFSKAVDALVEAKEEVDKLEGK